MEPDPRDVLTMSCAPATMWSTGNVSEAMPGVPTPLSYDLQVRSINIGSRKAFVDLGVLPRRGDPHHPDHCAVGVFSGRPAASVTAIARAISALPGSTVAGVTEGFFGAGAKPPPGLVDTRRRYPIIAARLPVNILTASRRFTAIERRVRDFRAANLPADGSDAARAQSVLRRGRELYSETMWMQMTVGFPAQGTYEQLAALAVDAGMPGAELRLVSGYGTVDEGRLATQIWEVAQGRRTLAEFLREFGHHGPDEGELSSRSWREDPSPIERAVRTIADLPESEHAAARIDRQRVQREATETELLAALPAAKRPGARLLLRLTRRFIALREQSKSLSHQVFDTCRAHARALGEALAAQGVLTRPDDVFYLTVDELLVMPGEVRNLVDFRRQRRELYLGLEVPEVFSGVPQAVPRVETAAGRRSRLTGVPVAPGRVVGTARVVLDPGAEDNPIEPGEVLVCRTTDPSWVSLMIGAAALVTDIGGVMSHAAIVARELGIPCIVGTGDGTGVIRSGDRLVVDGAAGTVDVERGGDDD